MNRIRPWLFIGKYRDTIDYSSLKADEIGAMLLLAEPVDHPGIVSLYLNVDDGVPLAGDALKRGINSVLEQKQAGRSTLIACGAGQSRSVVFGIAALKEGEGLSLMDALYAIRSQHSDAEPHRVLRESLWRHYGENVPYFDMLNVLEMKR
jgi:hypothetical protein